MNKIILFSLVIIVTGVALYFLTSNASPQTSQSALSTQSATIGIVIYKVTPKTLTSNSETWDFEVSLDTHTGSLDQDLMSTIRLVDDKGNEYKPTKWIGDPPGGHHREGVLKFSTITPSPAFIDLNIEVGSSEKASLRWNI